LRLKRKHLLVLGDILRGGRTMELMKNIPSCNNELGRQKEGTA
jgi:hypothetical protein